jgi:hypothetical protein
MCRNFLLCLQTSFNQSVFYSSWCWDINNCVWRLTKSLNISTFWIFIAITLSIVRRFSIYFWFKSAIFLLNLGLLNLSLHFFIFFLHHCPIIFFLIIFELWLDTFFILFNFSHTFCNNLIICLKSLLS